MGPTGHLPDELKYCDAPALFRPKPSLAAKAFPLVLMAGVHCATWHAMSLTCGTAASESSSLVSPLPLPLAGPRSVMHTELCTVRMW